MNEPEMIKELGEITEQEVGEVLEECDADDCERDAIPGQALCGRCQQVAEDESDEDNRNRSWIEARI